jgi:hypothetical protein
MAVHRCLYLTTHDCCHASCSAKDPYLIDSVLTILSNLDVFKSSKTQSKTSLVSHGDNHSSTAFQIAFSRLLSVTESTSLARAVSISLAFLAIFSSYSNGDLEFISSDALSHSELIISSTVSLRNS